jgi:hypothetical protein
VPSDQWKVISGEFSRGYKIGGLVEVEGAHVEGTVTSS